MSIIGFACSGASCSHCSEIRMKQFRSSRRLFAQRELLGECQNAFLFQLLLSRLLRRLYAAATYFVLLVAELLSIWYNTGFVCFTQFSDRFHREYYLLLE